MEAQELFFMCKHLWNSLSSPKDETTRREKCRPHVYSTRVQRLYAPWTLVFQMSPDIMPTNYNLEEEGVGKSFHLTLCTDFTEISIKSERM